jgi:hypothetical protein
VDVQGVLQQRVLSKEVIDALPTGRTTTNMAVLIPGMVLSTTFSGEAQDVGGNTGDVMQALSIHGGRGGDLRRMVDGLSMQSFGANSSAFAPNSGMIQEVAVDVAAGSAEQSTGGVRVNVTSRLRGGVLAQGGISTGRTLTDSCEIRAAVPEATVLNPYCRIQTPYLTQLKLLAAYTIPAIGVQASGTFQSVPGPLIQANAVYTSAQVAGSLGRPLAGAATAQVNVIAPGNAYGDRLNQLDFRVGKLLRFGRTKTALNVDIYNVFNDNAALTENASFAVFRQPLLVLNPRLVKFSVNLDF